MDCIEHISTPELPSDPCNGKHYNTKCVFSDDAFTLLDLPADSSLDDILNAMVLALNANKTRIDAQDTVIANLEETVIDLQTRVEELEGE